MKLEKVFDKVKTLYGSKLSDIDFMSLYEGHKKQVVKELGYVENLSEIAFNYCIDTISKRVGQTRDETFNQIVQLMNEILYKEG